MNDTNFDAALLDQLRHECELHSIDVSRAKIEPVATGSRKPRFTNEDGEQVAGAYREYTVRFDSPLCDITRFCPGAPTQLPARSPAQAEGLLLLWCKRIQIAERQAMRHGVVCGWDSARINREPVTADELNRYRARIKETAELQARIARELVAEVEQRQQEANQRAHDDLAQRYPNSVTAARKAQPAPVPELPNVPTKRTHGSASK